MNLKLIKKSKKYKTIKKNLKSFLSIYLVFSVMVGSLAIAMIFVNENILILSVAILVIVTIIWMIPVSVNLYLMYSMTMKHEKYKQYNGKIVMYKTIRQKHFTKTTKAVIYVEELDKSFEAVVYDKEFFIKKHHYGYIDFLYNEATRDIVIVDH